ncbi:MAG: exodeoxyribonuclease VII large subunit [Oscillospiraceae bacterium]|nr:exodeoxyribonuclease VII large subunit [Oscillospiraceae bacterium]
MAGFNILTVTQITAYLKSYIDENKKLSGIYIKGEITDFKANFYSGHYYFSLKDSGAEINCVMFRSYAERIRFMPENGMSVIVRCDLSVYQKACSCQLYVYDIQPEGLGAKHLAFEQLKAKLEAEGLFDEKYKKTLPQYPEKIGVITSGSGAAIQDIINVLTRRWPVAKIVLTPVSVQGEDSPKQLISALRKQDSVIKPDVIIIGRGGGSSEDLSAFNDETLAREIFACKTPVISAVGHETDFSICDFVSDLRALTPSAAAELSSPDINALRQSFDDNIGWMRDYIERKCDKYADLLSKFTSVKSKNFTDNFLLKYQNQLDFISEKREFLFKNLLLNKESKFSLALAKLDYNNPAKIFSKSVCRIEKDKKEVVSAKKVFPGDSIKIYFSDGVLKATVTEKEEGGPSF